MLPVADYKDPFFYFKRGFSLIEVLVSLLIFGFGLLILSTTLFPMMSKSSSSHYEARASALGQSVLSQILARQFDSKSDANGSQWRCDENPAAVAKRGGVAPDIIPACKTAPFQKGVFLAVDDYLGCWGENDPIVCSGLVYKGTLDALLSSPVSNDYKGFTLRINVLVDDSTFPNNTQNKRLHKRIDLEVDVGKYGKFDFSSYRSNF